ncbi:Hypothetical Protein RSKD131_1049 [Cereibacter sphaeroides KD131]|nr:Hypothetical Protein RSKD131_1049 [Cereibacter sphaeroides KD131]
MSHEKAHDGETARMAEGSKMAGGGLVFHISGFMEMIVAGQTKLLRQAADASAG